jgi:vacuolar-type H+-ATPase subunit H
MAKNSINEIKKIEKESTRQIEKKKKGIETEIIKAEQQALTHRKQVLKKTKQQVEKLKEETLFSTKQEVKGILENNKAAIKTIEQQAQQHIDQAVNFIIKEIIKGD